MATAKSAKEKYTKLFRRNLEERFQYKINIRDVFLVDGEEEVGFCNFIHEIFDTYHDVTGAGPGDILFITLVGISHYTQYSTFEGWMNESSGSQNINLFGLVVGYAGMCMFFRKHFWFLFCCFCELFRFEQDGTD